MFERFRIRRRNREIVDALYAQIVEQSRQPCLFTQMAIPDTVMGRFEALSIHVFLVLFRCKRVAALQPLAQDLVDRFMTDLDGSIRELGIGDQSVPKRMKRLAAMFYARADAYDSPLEAEDRDALARALAARIAVPESSPDAARDIASYMLKRNSELRALGDDRILSGHLSSEV
ncbi:ubiquinol-cytochrome C chaperone family protein [Mangrovibrevibacter kandeliae]|uniref:ubiquinol-cytochrome C chaperone family protein n=1 Tax=Mangrovibrevibacter kandeliae TaxID=2968473 RepID=UPI002117F593|nr:MULTISPECIES: ubiquinol-cytochrome C chaperone family protein [unclassified Aurantimonas]MCQ8781433.1 hypothetical protein [Aurantimonas sp. CSK15Z-1]MCW4114213.1 hypothetical protein [Aurantimonas sp. MSK8Z-1]